MKTLHTIDEHAPPERPVLRLDERAKAEIKANRQQHHASAFHFEIGEWLARKPDEKGKKRR